MRYPLASPARYSLAVRVATLAMLAMWGGQLKAEDVVFAGYNIENYSPVLVPGETGNSGKPKVTAGKTGEAADAVVEAIKAINPDVVGVCEMGARPQFEDFQKRLATAGLGYVDFEFVEGPDPDRHLALASRFPIISRQSLPDVSFDCNGVREKVRRGFLDVTVRVTESESVRFVGAHLKSKLSVAEGEETVRRNEAHLLHNHVCAILADDPAVNLVVYGDFNETKDHAAVQEIAGRRGEPSALAELALADSEGDRWTHYWKVDDVYSRIDYIFVSRALSPKVSRSKSYVYRWPAWNAASDHRPVVASLHFPKK